MEVVVPFCCAHTVTKQCGFSEDAGAGIEPRQPAAAPHVFRYVHLPAERPDAAAQVRGGAATFLTSAQLTSQQWLIACASARLSRVPQAVTPIQ